MPLRTVRGPAPPFLALISTKFKGRRFATWTGLRQLKVLASARYDSRTVTITMTTKTDTNCSRSLVRHR